MPLNEDREVRYDEDEHAYIDKNMSGLKKNRISSNLLLKAENKLRK